MIRSMTGYGKAESLVEGRRLQVEIKSVNHRYLDLSLRLPSVMLPLESEIRRKISEKFFRGRVEVNIRIDRDSGMQNGARLELNLPALHNYYALLVRMKQELRLSDDITLPMIAGHKDAFIASEHIDDAASLWEKLEGLIDMAIQEALTMREKEGALLCEDLTTRINFVKTIMNAIGSRAPAVVVEYQKRLAERVRELTAAFKVDDWRMSQEIAIMAERSDITEELGRFNKHICQFEELLQSDDSIGRKVDFLLQEINREINTIGSKSNDALISSHVIAIKSELGKLREQVQNIE